MKAYDLILLFLQKKLFFVLGVAHGDPIFAQVGQKNGNFQRFLATTGTTGFQLRLLMLSESPNIFHQKPGRRNQIGCSLGAKFGPNQAQCCGKSKEMGIINSFFSYFTWGVPFKAKNSGLQTSEWKFKENTARSITYEGRQGQLFAPFGSKMAKN